MSLRAPITLLLCVVGSACTRSSFDAELLEVQSISPEAVRTGETLRVEGEGFEPGAVGELVFSGTYNRPGAPPEMRTIRLEAHAATERRISALLSEEHVRTLGGRGSFVGRADVRFPGREGRALTGRLESVRLDVDPGRTPGAHRHTSEGRSAASRLGIVFDETTVDEGALIASVEGVAASCGVLAGDRIVAAGGVQVHALSDLRGIDRGGVEIEVLRDGRPLVLTTPGGEASGLSVPWLIAAVGLLLLLLLGPPAHWMARWSFALRRSWQSTRHGMGLQLLCAALIALVTLVIPKAGLLVACLALVSGLFADEQPFERLISYAPLCGALVFASRFMYLEAGGLHPSTWSASTELDATLMLVFSALALCVAARDGQHVLRGAVARGAGAVVLVSTFMTGHAFALAPLSMLLAAALPNARPPLPVLAALGACAFGLQRVSLAPSPDAVLLPISVLVAASIAWARSAFSTRRVRIGL